MRNTSSWRDALKEIAAQIDRVIRESPFPDGVLPDYLARAVRAYPERGGKRLRPAILMWSVGAAGGDPAQGLYAAAALEVLHNWTLVHDDIIDEDAVRRGEPTAHVALAKSMPGGAESRRAKFGSDMAILAGDVMQGWVFELLDRCELAPELHKRVRREFRRRGYLELISGEAVDVELSYRDPASVTTEELYAMQRGKTGALLRLAAEAGAAIALGDAAWEHPQLLALGDFAENLALAFQLRDDELGIFGDPEKFGKPIGSDLGESKATLLLIHALRHAEPADRARLTALLGRAGYTAPELDEARAIFRKCGAADELRREVRRFTEQAEQALAKLPQSIYRNHLAELARELVGREV